MRTTSGDEPDYSLARARVRLQDQISIKIINYVHNARERAFYRCVRFVRLFRTSAFVLSTNIFPVLMDETREIFCGFVILLLFFYICFFFTVVINVLNVELIYLRAKLNGRFEQFSRYYLYGFN